MYTEYEWKILDIDISAMKQKLRELGATYIGEKTFRRYVYDIHPPVYEKRIRLRTDWEKTTLTYKHIIDERAIDWVKEWEIIVDSFDTTNALLEQLWYTPKCYQENRRESYVLENCQIEIDHRPLIPPYMEIEWPNKESVLATFDKFDKKPADITSENTTQIYTHYGIDLESIAHLSFK